MRAKERRSDCPIAFSLDLIGDRWSLLILRDLMLRGKRHYEEFAAGPEGISTNILASRLRQLECGGLITKSRDEANRRRFIYRPTEKALDLLPMILEMILWGTRHDPEAGAPPEVIRAMETDRDAFIAGIRQQFTP